METVLGTPVWVWSRHATQLGVGPAWQVTGTGGGGRTLGPAQNTFGDAATVDRAAAEGLRAAYAGGNAGWLAQYNGNQTFLILLKWDGGEVTQRRNVAGDDWEDVTDVIRGPGGADGATGPGASIVTGPAYSAANNRIELTGLADPPLASMLFMVTPADLDRASAQLTLRAGAVEESLTCPRGMAVSARMLTPGEIVGVLRLAGGFQLIVHPPPRPQDYRAVFVVGEDAADDDLAAADLATARAAVSPEDGGLIDVAAAFAAAGVSSALTHRRYYWLGVPSAAPDPSRLWIDGAGRGTDRFDNLSPYVGGPDYGGEAYKWWRSPNTSGFTGSQRVRFLFEQGVY